MDQLQMDELDEDSLSEREQSVVDYFHDLGYEAVGSRIIDRPAPGGSTREIVFKRKKLLSFDAWMATGASFEWGTVMAQKASRACGFHVHVWYWICHDNFVSAEPLFKH